jgi:hypothetical protein
MAAGPWVITNAYKTRLLTGGLDFDASNALRCILLSSSSNIASGPADCYTGGTGTAVTGELSTANGYSWRIHFAGRCERHQYRQR